MLDLNADAIAAATLTYAMSTATVTGPWRRFKLNHLSDEGRGTSLAPRSRVAQERAAARPDDLVRGKTVAVVDDALVGHHRLQVDGFAGVGSW